MASATQSVSHKSRWSPAKRRENLYGYLFLAPWLIGFLGLFLGPGLASLYLSLTKYDVIGTPEFIGAANYIKMFTIYFGLPSGAPFTLLG